MGRTKVTARSYRYEKDGKVVATGLLFDAPKGRGVVNLFRTRLASGEKFLSETTLATWKAAYAMLCRLEPGANVVERKLNAADVRYIATAADMPQAKRGRQ